MYGVKYGAFIHGLSMANVSLNRKVLADLAFHEPLSFRSVVEVVKVESTSKNATPSPK